jgi:hypothetical protein
LFMEHCVLVRGDPHFYKEPEHNPAHVMVWAGMVSR